MLPNVLRISTPGFAYLHFHQILHFLLAFGFFLLLNKENKMFRGIVLQIVCYFLEAPGRIQVVS
jgi:hypothetical protein